MSDYYGDDSWDHAAADYSACVNEERYGRLQHEARAMGYASIEEALAEEGPVAMAEEAAVPLPWLLDEWPEFEEQAAQTLHGYALDAAADRYTRRAEQGFYDG